MSDKEEGDSAVEVNKDKIESSKGIVRDVSIRLNSRTILISL